MQIHNNYNMSSFKSLILTDSFKNELHLADVETQCKVSEEQEQLDNTRFWDLRMDYNRSIYIPTFVSKKDNKEYQVSSVKYIDGKEVYFSVKPKEEEESKVGVLEFDSYEDARNAFKIINNLQNEFKNQNSGDYYLSSIVSAAKDVTLSFENSKKFICE